jgi:hyaluronan synthase
MKVNINHIYIIILVLLLVIPIILQYIFGWNVFFFISYKRYNISVYGFYLFGYMLLQFMLAVINNRLKVWKMDKRSGLVLKKVNIMVVGYREDPVYYKMCLESIKTAFSNGLNLNKVYIIIDGNEKEDEYMIDLFYTTFVGNKCIHINLPENTNTDDYLTVNHMETIKENDIICIAQKHGGKRCAMMTGFKITLLENALYDKNIGSIFCTDSDTVINPDCIVEMYEYFKDTKIGAVAGNLGIYNKYDSVVSFLSSIRYWYAFNLERAYQSFAGGVMCVSGPIGMYNLDYLEMIIEDWSKQEFLGKLCTYGDDRHLTNKILGLEKKVIYLPDAYAETETPISLYRFFQQQTRWSKSAFREVFWSVGNLDKHSLMMTVDLVYVLVFPYIVMSYLLYILFVGTVFELGFYTIILFLIGLVKSIYGSILGKRIENMFYFLYGFVYITIVFPAKIWAMLNINDNSWGTSSRKVLNRNISFDILVPILWNLILAGGLVSNILRGINSNNSFSDFLYIIIVSSIWVLCFGVMYMYVTIKRTNERNTKNERKIE